MDQQDDTRGVVRPRRREQCVLFQNNAIAAPAQGARMINTNPDRPRYFFMIQHPRGGSRMGVSGACTRMVTQAGRELNVIRRASTDPVPLSTCGRTGQGSSSRDGSRRGLQGGRRNRDMRGEMSRFLRIPLSRDNRTRHQKLLIYFIQVGCSASTGLARGREVLTEHPTRLAGGRQVSVQHLPRLRDSGSIASALSSMSVDDSRLCPFT